MSAEASETVASVIRERRTVYKFKPEVPPVERVQEAIELARWAPNHRHTEPWHFYLLGEETIAGIVDLNARLVTANKGAAAGDAKRVRWSAVPGWLAVTCCRSEDVVRETEDYAACCCAVQNLSLYLWTHGIGVKWSSGEVTRHHELYELLNVDPQTQRIIGLFWYGYPEVIPAQRRKPVEAILTGLP